MPLRSLNTSVLVWPNKETVVIALQQWAVKALETNPHLEQVGYFGSYARGDWGVGSDLDVILIVTEIQLPFERRSAQWDLTEIPVPVDVLVYTRPEWEKILQQPGFGKRLASEVVWVR